MSFADALRRATARGQPIEALIAPDVLVNDSVLDSPEDLALALCGAAAIPEGRGGALLLPRQALAFAVLDPGAGDSLADARFGEALGGCLEDAGLRQMARKAARGPPEIGIVATAGGRTGAVCVASAAFAARWPLPAELRARLVQHPHWIAVAALAPVRGGALRLELEQAFALSPLEAGVTAAMLEAPSVEIVAQRLGLPAGRAREALARARRKLGAPNVAAMTRLIVEAMLRGSSLLPGLNESARVAELMDLTPAEARVALLAAGGASAVASAAALGIGVETVKSHLRAAFAKVGVNRSRELGRLAFEASTLDSVRRTAEVVAGPAETAGRLRLLRTAEGRTVAYVDYGGGPGLRPLFVCHGFSGGRRLPDPLVQMLQAQGWRPVVPQRPGYGQTDAVAQDRYAEAAGADMAAIADALEATQVDVLARDSSAPGLFALAAARPGLVGAAALLNPKAPLGCAESGVGILAACSRFLMRHPGSIRPFAEMLRRQLRTDLLERVLLRGCRDSASDAAAVAEPAVMRRMVHDIQALVARSSDGVSCEQATYAAGWRPRPEAGAGVARWAVAYSTELGFFPGPDIWRDVLGVAPQPIEGGYLVQFTHPGALVRLLGGRPR